MGDMMGIKTVVNIVVLVSVLIPSYTNAYVTTYETHLTVSEEYNDNIYQDPENEIDDFITLVSPGFQSQILWQRAGMSASYDLGLSFYDKESQNDSTRHNASIGSWWNITQNTQVSVTDRWIRSEDVVDRENTGNEANNREPYDINTATLDLNHRFGERRNINLGYRHTLLDNKDETIEDNQSHNANASLSYFFSQWLGIESSVDYTRGLYDISQDFDEINGTFRLIKVLSRQTEVNIAYTHSVMTWDRVKRAGQTLSENDYQVYNPSIGLVHNFRNDTKMDLSLGYFVQDIENQDNESGPTVNGNIGKTWMLKRGLFQLSGSSGYEESQLGTDNLGFTVYYGANALFQYSMTRELSSSVDCSYRNNDYVNTGNSSIDDRTDKIMSASWRLDWDVKRWLRAAFQYRFRQNDSNRNANDYIENRILVSLTFIPFQKTGTQTN
jgi:hypothetical protein